MADYVTDGLTTDVDDILAGMITAFQAEQPDWVPYDGNPETQLMKIIAFRHGVTLDVASQVLTAIYRYYGLSLAGVQPLEASFARVDATFTMVDTAGYTIPDGLQVDIKTSGNTAVRFLVEGDHTVASGSSTATVSLVAEETGSQASGLTGTASDVDGLDYIVSIVLAGPTAGGQDGETDAEYLPRLSRRLQRTSDKIITAEDAELAILDEVPGVGRVLVLDNYIPADHPTVGDPEQFDVPGAFTVVVATAAGANVPTDTKNAVIALLAAKRILNLDVYVIDPTRTNVTVEYTATAFLGFDPVDVKARADQAVTDYLSGTGWGLNTVSAGDTTWNEDLTVRFSEIYSVLNNVTGVDHVTDVKVNGTSNVNATIVGPGALPNLTTLTGTVT